MTRIAARPAGPVAVPPRVRSIAGTDAVETVWRNESGGLTFRLSAAGGGERYVKWSARGDELAAESARLRWASNRAAVPVVLDEGRDESGAWLVTRGIPARSAVDPVWLRDPGTAARAIGHGLRVLHDALPVDECPFEWSVAGRLARVDERIASGATSAGLFPEHRHLTIAEARTGVDVSPDVDRLVVCHGDPCAPNTLIDARGEFAAHVDLGSLGVADRWADLAVAAWSTEWNYGPGYEARVYEAYGVEPDADRIAYYRLLWDLG